MNDFVEKFRNAGYGVYNHSAVAICTWTKKAIREGRFCYKNKFYGIDTHRCMQITQSVAWCTNRCIYCWRPNEYFFPRAEFLENVDPPGEILEKLRKIRKQLLSGFWGDPKADKKLLKEAEDPNHITFSLSGEPLLYPYVPESIEYIRKNWEWKSIFVVTNGLIPEEIKRMKGSKTPTQLYISLTAPTPDMYLKVSRPVLKDAWERLHESLNAIKKGNYRKVARITLIKGLNDTRVSKWSELLENFDYVEVKAYMHLGMARKRLFEHNMPEHEYVRNWSFELLDYLPEFSYKDEDQASRVVLLEKANS